MKIHPLVKAISKTSVPHIPPWHQGADHPRIAPHVQCATDSMRAVFTPLPGEPPAEVTALEGDPKHAVPNAVLVCPKEFPKYRIELSGSHAGIWRDLQKLRNGLCKTLALRLQSDAACILRQSLSGHGWVDLELDVRDAPLKVQLYFEMYGPPIAFNLNFLADLLLEDQDVTLYYDSQNKPAMAVPRSGSPWLCLVMPIERHELTRERLAWVKALEHSIAVDASEKSFREPLTAAEWSRQVQDLEDQLVKERQSLKLLTEQLEHLQAGEHRHHCAADTDDIDIFS